MAEESKDKQIRVLIIGTGHQIQRHQDTQPEREKRRAEFEECLRQIIKERKIELIAEEAGDDAAVWEKLSQEDELVGEFADAFGIGSKTVDKPVPTIAKNIADEHPGVVRHVDIRAPNAEELTVEQRDDAMAAKITDVLKTAESAVVIVGEDHREGVSQRLKAAGL